MKKLLFFLISLFLFFAAGFFLDAVFHFWGVLTNVILLWFFIVASYRLSPHEVVYAGWLTVLMYGFFAAGLAWFWFFVFLVLSFVVIAAHGLVGVSGRFQFFFFLLTGWLGALLVRILAFSFSASARATYGTIWHYVISPALGWEIVLSAAFLFCVAVAAYVSERNERTYYV